MTIYTNLFTPPILAIPAVVSGKNHRIAHKSSGPKILIPFSILAGKFYVEMCFE